MVEKRKNNRRTDESIFPVAPLISYKFKCEIVLSKIKENERLCVGKPENVLTCYWRPYSQCLTGIGGTHSDIRDQRYWTEPDIGTSDIRLKIASPTLYQIAE
jgi:hypothetical protein